MRNLIVPALLAASLAVGGVAVAATTTPAPAKAHTTTAAANPKAADCEKQWKAEKKHTETRKAFMAACEKA
jgi:hypothetical protein